MVLYLYTYPLVLELMEAGHACHFLSRSAIATQLSRRRVIDILEEEVVRCNAELARWFFTLYYVLFGRAVRGLGCYYDCSSYGNIHGTYI